jgi:hypothetical protein
LRHYYYTVAALETIRLEEKVPISEASFCSLLKTP